MEDTTQTLTIGQATQLLGGHDDTTEQPAAQPLTIDQISQLLAG